MSRVLELIKRYVTDVGRGDAGVESFRLFNDPKGGGTHAPVRMSVSFRGGRVDNIFRNCLIGTGIYLDDTFSVNRLDGRSENLGSIGELPADDNCESMEIGFCYEKKPVTSDLLVKILQAETIFGLPVNLYKNFPISRLKIYFGANQAPLALSKGGPQELRVYQSHPYVFETTKAPSIEYLYLDDRANLASVKKPIVDYLNEELSQLLSRHAYTPKVGMRISSLFPASFFSDTTPLLGWAFIRQNVDAVVREDLVRHTTSQVNRISHRLREVGRRQKITYKGLDFGLMPINEVETVLLFQRIALSHPHLLPGGLKVALLDYSPKDIDSICRFQLSQNHPEEVGPVEFEYSLASFFKHGHDYRQVKLIICYTASPLSFPYAHGGISYFLDRSGDIPRLTNKADHSSIPCIIIEDLFR
jgi:hypothetical protein